MKRTIRLARALCMASFTPLLVLSPSLASGSAVEAGFDLSTPQGGPFPSDRFTVADSRHLTGLRVNLPTSDCQARPSDCEDVDVINELDGFNLQPRLSIPFDGAIDVTTVTSQAVFLLSLGSPLLHGDPGGKVIGINQVVWDVATNTLHAESDKFLDQHTRYALIVTRGVLDSSGDPVGPTEAFRRFRHDLNFGQTENPDLQRYRKGLLDALAAAATAGVPEHDIVTASVFTTLSATAVLEKIRDQIKTGIPVAADFLLGPGGSRTVFPASDVTGITFSRQTGTGTPPTFSAVPVIVGALTIAPGAVGELAFGKYVSPDYRTPHRVIPRVGTRSGAPAVESTSEIFFNLFLPSGPRPAPGWPVVIFGPGLSNNKQSTPLFVAAKLAAQGLATIAINSVGAGLGPLSELIVSRASGGPVTFSAGGRGADDNGDGVIGIPEGFLARPPVRIIRDRDAIVQTVVDLMQLVRVIEVGMDVDGDGNPDLDPSRIYYLGNSFGGMVGAVFLAADPSVRAGVLNTVGGPSFEWRRLGATNRAGVASVLGARVPSLLNGGTTFDENMPFRDQPPLINAVPGAMEIQAFFENAEWVGQSGDQVAYAPHLRKAPLDGVGPKSVLIQFAKGDKTVPNPSTTNILRAGDLADRATYFRNDLMFAGTPGLPAFLKDPHGFAFPQPPNFPFPVVIEVALGTQDQWAIFLASDGMVVLDPDGPGPLLETPIVPPLPESLSFIP